MTVPLLESKLCIPRPRRSLVPRSRIGDRLDRGTESALTLICAPAGFGKTTALTDWIASASMGKRSVAWLSLDPRDDDPVLFWTYLVAALGRAVTGLGANTLGLLQPPLPPIESVLSTLLNELHATPADLVLVLEDYHFIHSSEIHGGMEFLVQNLPPQTHLVITGRSEPALPLARLRAREALVEIRARHLGFTLAEAAEYLNGTMGLSLTAADIATLDVRTEGWIAALQLAAISLQGHENASGFIAGFAGDDRYVVDYLGEEVLRGQPPGVQDFLLQTSILERLSGPLCEAVSGQRGGQATLERLDTQNLFLTPLDDRRHWYRYHQLFADVLRARLLDEHPGEVAELHTRASAWCERNGDPQQAVHHAFAAQDFPRAARLLEHAVEPTRRNRSEAALLGWLKQLPTELLRTRPVLSVAFAGALLTVGELDDVEGHLQLAEQWLSPSNAGWPESAAPAAGMTIVDEHEFRRLPATISLYRAALSLAQGDSPGAARHARKALEASPEQDRLARAAANGLLGLAAWGTGDLEGGIRGYESCVAGLRRAGHIADTFGCAVALADLRLAQGRLSLALSTCTDTVAYAAGTTGGELRGTADMHVAMSAIHLERNEISAATTDLLLGRSLGEHLGLPQNPYRWRVAMAAIKAAEGDLDGSLELLDAAGHVYVGDFFPQVRPIAALRARLLATQGRTGEAFGWARDHGISPDDTASYLHEFDHITLAGLLLARYGAERVPGDLDDSQRLLERLLQAAEAGNRTGSIIEILVLLSLAHRARGNMAAALASLQRALVLAEPEGYVRIFANAGAPMASLLATAAKQGMAPAYVRRLRAAMGGHESPTQIGLIEPLSDRELDVLRLLATELDGPDIARELMVSLNTVRTHTSHIYAKLGVNSRRGAIRRANELKLLPRSG